ncbi:hypothetical protein E1292_36890 [Nonomuraea deserti]|uniref:Uncharacterized protein n=1 Tax=Nonomuraea deserti TaxID=1848322 RepID=A0A4R4VD91_9ACTN|nr:hypothetical protein [Nonomuraea deserti]TDC97549.1 hypothetical protein E1292_36890 [Nonomuraea deserti]
MTGFLLRLYDPFMTPQPSSRFGPLAEIDVHGMDVAAWAAGALTKARPAIAPAVASTAVEVLK